MSHTERSTEITHANHPDQYIYDSSYYRALKDHITGDVLDIGAGALMFVKLYIHNPSVKSVLTIDKFTFENYSSHKLTKQTWVYPEELPSGKFDTIVSTEFIEHIEKDEVDSLLKQIKKRLKGKFVGSTPNKKHPTTNPYHMHEYTLEEMREILERHFSDVEIYDTGANCTVWIAQN